MGRFKEISFAKAGKGGFIRGGRFTVEEGNKLIRNIAKKLREFGSKWKRNIEFGFQGNSYSNGTWYLEQLNFKSKDGVIAGIIKLKMPMFEGRDEFIAATIDFESDDIKVKKEYIELSNLIHKELPDEYGDFLGRLNKLSKKLRVHYEKIGFVKHLSGYIIRKTVNMEDGVNLIKALKAAISNYEGSFKRSLVFDYRGRKQGLFVDWVVRLAIKSKDGVIDGFVEFLNEHRRVNMVVPPRVYAEFAFNSTNINDKREYAGLSAVIKRFLPEECDNKYT
jgi:hypothetical protein